MQNESGCLYLLYDCFNNVYALLDNVANIDCVWKSDNSVKINGQKLRVALLANTTNVHQSKDAFGSTQFLFDSAVAKKYSAQLLLSSIQKDVRRKNAANACAAASLLLWRGHKRSAERLVALVRRLPNIVFEDALYNRFLFGLVWLMIALSARQPQGFATFLDTNPRHLAQFETLALLAAASAACEDRVDVFDAHTRKSQVLLCREHSRSVAAASASSNTGSSNVNVLPAMSMFFSDIVSASRHTASQQQQVVFYSTATALCGALCASLRFAYGGMKGDTRMLHDLTRVWLRRHNDAESYWSELLCRKAEPNLVDSVLSEPFRFKLALEAVDFHVFRSGFLVMTQQEASSLGVTLAELLDAKNDSEVAERLQCAVWMHRSSIYAAAKYYLCSDCVDRMQAAHNCNELREEGRRTTQSDFDRLQPFVDMVAARIISTPYHYTNLLASIGAEKKRAEKGSKKRKLAAADADSAKQSDDTQRNIQSFFQQQRQ